MAKNFIKLGSDPKRVEFTGEFILENEFIYEFFNGKRATEYDATFERALTLGCYALSVERIGAFLASAEVELDLRLEELKALYTIRTLKEKYAGKGAIVEADIASVLQDFIDQRGWSDTVSLTGETIGVIPRRKVGDLVAAINGSDNCRVVIESKWDKSVDFGDPTILDESKNVTKKSEKTAYGQNLTALINREADVTIFISDTSIAHDTISNNVDGILFQPEIPGFIVLVNRDKGDWTNLFAAYSVARALAILSSEGKYEADRIAMIAKRLIRDLNNVFKLDAHLAKIDKGANQVLAASSDIRDQCANALQSAVRAQELLTRSLTGEAIPDLDWKTFYDETA